MTHTNTRRNKSNNTDATTKHWIHYEFNTRQRRTLFVLAIFILLGFFSTYMYVRSEGEYGVVSNELLESIIDIEVE